MRCLIGLASAVACALSVSVSSVFACGAPTQPPPPPPAPPIVCCVVIDWFIRPNEPECEYILVRYFRQDGLPLYQSNPMPLAPSQFCLCSLPPLPSDPTGVGPMSVGFRFGAPGTLPCDGLPNNAPGYGPFQQVSDPNVLAQVREFNSAYAKAAGDTVPQNAAPQVFGFGGPGTIPPGVAWDIYQLIKVPRGYDPRNLCPFAGAMGIVGLFLGDAGLVLAEPIAPGLPPIPIQQFAQNPGQSAFYKFKWYPVIIPPPCPPCPGDINGDGQRDFADLNILLGVFNIPCP